MNKLIIPIVLIMMTHMLFACASTMKDMATVPSIKFAEATLTKRLYVKETTAVPIEPTLIFTTEDSEAISYVKLKNLTGEHKLRWDWIGPKGEIYSSSGDYALKTSKGRYREEVVAWHKLSIRGDSAFHFPGEWQIMVYLDDTLIIQKGFTIETDVETLPEITKRADSKSWGLIIGIDRYSALPSVDYAENDSNLMKVYFTKILGVPEENIISLTGSEATKSSIKGYIRGYIPKNVDSDTTLYVYYAGHGLPYPEDNRIEPYLLPYDSDTKTIMETGYRLQDFYDDLAALPVKRAFVFLDACFSGGAARGDT